MRDRTTALEQLLAAARAAELTLEHPHPAWITFDAACPRCAAERRLVAAAVEYRRRSLPWLVLSWAPQYPRETVRIDGHYATEAAARDVLRYERRKRRRAILAVAVDSVPLNDELFRQIEAADVRRVREARP